MKSRPPPAFDEEIYKRRNTMERALNRLKQWRGIATRDEECAPTFLGGVLLAATIMTTRTACLPGAGDPPSWLLAVSPGAECGCGREAGALSPDRADRQAVVDGRGGITVDQDEICPQALLDAAPIAEAEPSCRQ